MNKISLSIVTLALIFNLNPLSAQVTTDYSTASLNSYNDNMNPANYCVSSTYWYGDTYTFKTARLDNASIPGVYLEISAFTINDLGQISGDFNKNTQILVQKKQYVDNLPLPPAKFQVSSCVYKDNLYGFYWLKGKSSIEYVKKTMDNSAWDAPRPISLSSSTVLQMATVAYQDTLYLFFVDNLNNQVKYYKLVENSNHILENITPTPLVLSNKYTSIGSVAAITYIDSDMKEKIMVAFPGVAQGSPANNKINIYTGTPDHFSLLSRLPSAQDHMCPNISIAQGSVKGGSQGSYNIQFGYTHSSADAKGIERCEYDVDNKTFSSWESLKYPSNLWDGASWYSEFYTRTNHSRHKYLLQGYIYGDNPQLGENTFLGGNLWMSDKLEFQDEKSEIPPMSRAPGFYDLILVAEGAPPYALNGYKLGDPVFNDRPLSKFSFTNNSINAVSTSTTYKQSNKYSVGVGPVTAGFKATFLKSSGSSNTTSLSITQSIVPPLSQQDSSGLMWYYYIVPTVTRSRWIMQDYNGNNITPNRNLFFFTFNSPQLRTITKSLVKFGDNSPRAYNLFSYENRGVEFKNGMQMLVNNGTDINIKGGGTGSMDLTFSQTTVNSSSNKYKVKLGIDPDGEIFNLTAKASSSVTYTRTRTATYSNSFHIQWSLFAPKDKTDAANIRRYTVNSYIMKTTDSSAYYLPDSLKTARPFFITYQVSNIEQGDFLSGISENKANADKYKFSNYPNPCTTSTSFNYSLPKGADVRITLYNALGQKIFERNPGKQNYGKHIIRLNTSDLSTGAYYYRLMINNQLIVGKLIKE